MSWHSTRPLNLRLLSALRNDNDGMASKGLTKCWREAMAAKPSDWELRGVVLGPREADPAIRGPRWAAWAVGPNGERLQAEADSPHDALTTLALRLRELEA